MGFRLLQHLVVPRQHLVAAADDRLERIGAHGRLGRRETRSRRNVPRGGEAERGQQAHIPPADIELVPLVREARRSRVGMVVVVQLRAADQEATGQDVGARVGRRPLQITPVMADAVDHRGCEERNPGNLGEPDQHAGDDAKDDEVEPQRDEHAVGRELAVEIALDPVIRRAAAIAFHRFRLRRFLDVKHHAQPEHAVDAIDLRAVRVLRRLAFGLVLAVHRHPFPGQHARGEPQPEPQEMTHRRMQVERVMRLAAMQAEGDADDGDVRERERGYYVAPPGKIEQAGEEHLRLSVHGPAKRRAGAARLAADFPGGAAGLALIPQAAGRDLVRAVAAPAVEHALAPVIEIAALVRERRADVADAGRLGELVSSHEWKIRSVGCQLRAPRRLAEVAGSSSATGAATSASSMATACRSMYVTERSRPARGAKMSPMKPSPQMTTLSRALADCGGEAPLAKKLGVSVDVLAGWLRGHEVLPADMYLRARELAAVRRR